MEQVEEEDGYAQEDEEYSQQAPSPMPSPTPTPEPTLELEEEDEELESVGEDQEIIDISDDEMNVAQDDGHPPSPPHDGSDGGDGSPPPMGWTVKERRLRTCDTISHHRLVGILSHYYADWNPTVEYVCTEYTHPLEATYWKSAVTIFSAEEGQEPQLLERIHFHWGHRSTMESSIEDAAFQACLSLRGHRHEPMQHDHHRFLPYEDSAVEGGWAVRNPEGLDPVSRVMVHFGHDMMMKVRSLENMVYQQGKDMKRLQKHIDDLRASMGELKIYEKLEPSLRP